MKHKNYSKRTVIAAGVILVTIVCTILGFSTLRGIENEYRYAGDDSLAQDAKYIKQNELAKVLRNYDQENIALAFVYLADLDDEIINAYIFLMCYEKRPDSEWENGIKSLASEELGLDIQNIYVDYPDF